MGEIEGNSISEIQEFISRTCAQYEGKINACLSMNNTYAVRRRDARKANDRATAASLLNDIVANRARINSYHQAMSELETVSDLLPIEGWQKS